MHTVQQVAPFNPHRELTCPQADLNDKPSLVKAMTGAAAVFTMTNYWEKMDMDLEIQQGKNLADAAKEAGVSHYIWSSLLNVNKRKSRPVPRLAHSHPTF